MRQKYEKNSLEWNSRISIFYNLEELFEMKLTPKPNDSNGNMVGDRNNEKLETVEWCAICKQFALVTSGSAMVGPSVYCETPGCNRTYHEICLNKVTSTSLYILFIRD
jgi:hypothetical protein